MLQLSRILFLLNLVLNFLKSSSLVGLGLGADDCPDVKGAEVHGSKRKFEEVKVIGFDAGAGAEQIDRSAKRRKEASYYAMCAIMKTAIEGVKSKTVIEYETSPETDFVDKLVRRSAFLPLKNDPDDYKVDALWGLPCTLKLSTKFHTEALFFILTNQINFSEHALVEYFLFLYDKWTSEDSDLSNLIGSLLIKICELSIILLFNELLEVAFKQIESESKALKILLFLTDSPLPELEDFESDYKWKTMCLTVMKRFPLLAYNPKLRLERFMGAQEADRKVFVHFLPILRTLLIENVDDFAADLDNFDDFALFHLGDLESAGPMGIGGLKVINEMFLRSKFTLSAFDSPAKFDLKVLIIERLFDALFLGLKDDEIVELLFKNDLFTIFESFMKYRTPPARDPAILLNILMKLLSQPASFNQSFFVFVVLAYSKIPETIWSATKVFKSSTFFKLMYEAIANVEFNLNLKLPGTNMKIPVSELEILSRLSDIHEMPFQLELGRLFLARACGVPLEISKVFGFTFENYEWREVVGFVNFYVDRAAALSGYTDGHSEFMVA